MPQQDRSGGISRRTFISRAAKTSAAVGIAGGLATVLEACTPAATPAATTAPTAAAPTAAPATVAATRAPVTGKLEVNFLGNAATEQAWKAYWEFFKSRYPGIEVTPVAIPTSLGWTGFIDAVNARIAGGRPPDIAQVATQGLLLFTSRSMPIDDLVKRDQKEIDELLKNVSPNWKTWLAQTSPDGKQYYLPGESFNTMCIYYNTEVFRDAGVPDPSPNWTWSDFEDVCRKVSKGTDRYAFNIDIRGGASFQSLDPWLRTNGASLLSDDWKKATLDTPAAIEAVTFEKSLATQKFIPTPGGTFDQYAAAAQGKLAMIGGGAWPALSLRDTLSKWKIVPWPQNKSKGSPVGWRSNAIMSSSQNKEAAWEFVKFASSAESSEYFNVRTMSSGVPAHSTLFTRFAANRPPGTNHLYEALEYAKVNPSPRQANEMERAIADGLIQILLGNTPVQAGLTALNQKIQALL